MFDAVRNNQKLVQILLALIILPFAFWGVESYIRNVGTTDSVAKVGGSKISPQEFRRAMREQEETLRRQLGDQLDPAMTDSPKFKQAVLNQAIDRQLQTLYAAKEHLLVSDQQLAEFIASVPALQENGKFSPERYEAALANQGKSKPQFEAELREYLAVQQIQMAVGDGSMPGAVATERWLDAMLQQREISEAVVGPDKFADKVKIAPEAIKAYYDANPNRFEVPEQVRAEYVVLDQSDERRASHILIRVDKGATPEQEKAAQAKAEEILAKAEKSPGEFAKLAKEYSQDPGSAANGGDLDWFGRGMMTKAFEEAAFSVRSGIVPKLVRTEFGFHIIDVTGARPDRAPAGSQSPAELADGFSNTVYEQSDSLKPAAEKFKLPIQQSGWIVKGGHGGGPMGNAKMMAALFSDDVVKNGRNTEAIEVSPNVLVSARVVEHKPASVQPLAVVSPTIEKLLAHQEAEKLAAKDGADKLAALEKGDKADLTWSAPRTVTRAKAQGLSAEAVRAVFGTDAAKLPAYAGVDGPNGYTVYRISAVKPYVAGSADAQEAQALQNRYRRIVAEEELAAWQGSLKDRFPVSIDQKAVEATKDR
jgi:peptidyl-prolyl cis-trans isomerase D